MKTLTVTAADVAALTQADAYMGEAFTTQEWEAMIQHLIDKDFTIKAIMAIMFSRHIRYFNDELIRVDFPFFLADWAGYVAVKLTPGVVTKLMKH